MSRVTHDGRTTAFGQTDREGHSILCVHGSGGTRAVWKAQRARLAGTVTALDLAGHGDSPPAAVPPGPARLRAYVADVAAVATAVDADVLVGHSLGGAVVLQTLLDRDLGVDAAVVIGAGATLPVSETLLEWLAEDFDRVIEFLHGPDRLFHAPDDRLIDRSRTLLESVGQPVTRADFQTCTAYDVTDRLPAIEVPVLAVVGAHDQLTPPRLQDPLVAGLPEATRTEIADAAHMAMVERPDAVNEAITAFLERRT
ncbi:MAG: alpha/beta fold hydrolase [Halobacteriaceae archaeon]